MCVSNEGEKDEVSEHTPIRAAYKRSQENTLSSVGVAGTSDRRWQKHSGLVWCGTGVVTVGSKGVLSPVTA